MSFGIVKQEATADKKARLTTKCLSCKKESIIEVPQKDYYNWRFSGQLIQEAFPYLNADKREQLLTGYCPTCWDTMFKEEE